MHDSYRIDGQELAKYPAVIGLSRNLLLAQHFPCNFWKII